MPYLSQEENNLIHNYIILPYAKKVLEKDISTLNDNSTLKVPFPYVKLAEEALIHVNNDIRHIRHHSFKMGLKVHREGIEGDNIIYKWFYKGYEGTRHYSSHVLKTHVGELIYTLMKR